MREFMSNKAARNLVYSVIVALIIAILLLYIDFLIGKDNTIIQKLTQGEVLAGIFIALPTLTTWINSISQSREQDKKMVSENAMEIVKYYDKELADLVDSILEKNEITLTKALQIEYIISTFNKLFTELDAKREIKISLNYAQVLSAICSISYPEDIENLNFKGDNWKNALATALQPTLHEINKTGKIEVLQDPSIVYFSLINFGEKGLEFNNIEFKMKHFVECTFTKKFIKDNRFEKCKFSNCTIVDFDDDSQFINKLKSKGNEVMTLRNSEGELLDTNPPQKDIEELIVDTRENLIVNQFIEGNRCYKITKNATIDRNKIREYIIDRLCTVHSKIGLDSAKNNKKISISKNYITEENRTNFDPNSKWSGWHSIFKDKVEKATNFKYYIFVVEVDSDYHVIVFETSNFKNYLKEKVVDKSGKYNFYFNLIKN